jgi:uncharacterized protein
MQAMPEIALTPDQQAWVQQAVQSIVPGAQILVFGSRATGKARPFSDLDLLLSLPEPLTWQQRCMLADTFDNGPLPFRVDVVETSNLAAHMRSRVLQEVRPL